MLPNSTYKEARMASIEVLFHFFKATPSSYYKEIETVLTDGSIQISKNKIQTIRKELDRNLTSFNFVEITGMYLSAYDQKIFRAIIQSVYKEDEQLFQSNLVNAKCLNEEYLVVNKDIYSNRAILNINNFYKILNPTAKSRSSAELFEKIVNSLQRLAQVSLSFFTKDKRTIITAPLLIFSKVENELYLQLHPTILSFKYESKNEGIIKVKQPYYNLDNCEYFKLENDLQRLLYSKIQYKFASMGKIHNACRFNFEELKTQIFLPTNSIKSSYNQSTKLKNTIKELDKSCSYTLKLENSAKTLELIVNR